MEVWTKRFSNCCGVEMGENFRQNICPNCMEPCRAEVLDQDGLPARYMLTTESYFGSNVYDTQEGVWLMLQPLVQRLNEEARKNGTL